MYILPSHHKDVTCTKCSAKNQGDTFKKSLYAESQSEGRYFNVYDLWEHIENNHILKKNLFKDLLDTDFPSSQSGIHLISFLFT